MAPRLLLVVAAAAASPQAYEIGKLPAMGYNTWNDVRCDGVDAKSIMDLAHGLVKSNFSEKGYAFLNVDDCWQAQLLGAGDELVPDAAKFPDGLQVVVDGIHALGLRFGLYADRGFYTCAFRAGSRHQEEVHAKQFHDWQIDYLKYDSCWAPNLRRQGALEDYARMRDALAQHAPGVHYSLCGWSSWYAPLVSNQAGYHSWRIGADCDEFANIYEAARTMEGLAHYAGPGKGYNDPDMLVGTSTGAVTLTPRQSRTQFDLWCVLAAPLLLGTNPARMNNWDLETYGAEDVIRVNQDPLGRQGVPVHSTCPQHNPKDNWWCSPWSMPRDVFEVWTGLLRALAAILLTSAAVLRGTGRSRLAFMTFLLAIGSVGYIRVLHDHRPRIAACQQVWAKPLADGDTALLFVNWAPDDIAVACDAECLARAGLAARPLYVRDVREKANRAPLVDGASVLVQRLDGGGGSVLFRVGW